MQRCSLYRVHKIHARTEPRTDGTTAALLYPHRNALRGDKNMNGKCYLLHMDTDIHIYYSYTKLIFIYLINSRISYKANWLWISFYSQSHDNITINKPLLFKHYYNVGLTFHYDAKMCMISLNYLDQCRPNVTNITFGLWNRHNIIAMLKFCHTQLGASSSS